MVKASDLRSVFGHVTQDAPLYRHAGVERNVPVRGVDSGAVKFRRSLCQDCNNRRTQPHDRAWEALLRSVLAHRPPLGRGSRLPLDQVFGAELRERMLCVHLFFLKLLGCYAVEHRVPLPIKAFAVAILAHQAHPHVFMSFVYESSNEGRQQIQVGSINAVDVDGEMVGASWFYVVGTLGVEVVYFERGRPDRAGRPVWHPDDVSTEISLL